MQLVINGTPAVLGQECTLRMPNGEEEYSVKLTRMDEPEFIDDAGTVEVQFKDSFRTIYYPWWIGGVFQ